MNGDVEARRLWGWLVAESPLVIDTAEAVFGFVLRATPGWRLGREINLVESGVEPNITRSIRIEGSEEVLGGSGDGDD
ncbi:hypothetical protein [Mycobacterium marinum]|uniref:hypothetical protein n=1 Tax=Mycobacterium marinum TaxID=1781 RepID=UPI0019235044|nr:hypothetical protein [Mycobacterium marinum]QQW33522.1 hypothetical protein HXW97_06565 [Mycobacterium marinum]